MDLEIIILSEVSQIRERQGILKKKKDTSEFMYKTKTDPQTQRTNLQLQKGKEGTEEFQINIYTTYKKDN